MRRTKSFSNYGAYLERKGVTRTNPEMYDRNITRAKEEPMEVTKKQPLFVQGFDRVTTRQKPSSYQLYNIKDFNNQSNYQPKNEFVQTRSAFYPIKRESQPRLKNLIVEKEKYQPTPMEKSCTRLKNIQRDQTILTTRDLQYARKTYHSMDFSKQSERPNSYITRQEGRQTIYNDTRKTKETELVLEKGNPLNKTSSVHSFGSYTKRQFLSQKKLSLKRAPPSSGAECFKIPQEKYKNNWKVVQAQKFEKVAKKHLNRFDATNDPWHTKINYNPKEQLVKKRTPILKMSEQTDRKMNQVHSKYPIRLAA